MANGDNIEPLLKAMLSADNQTRQAAEATFEQAKEKGADGLVASLMQVLRGSTEWESRGLTAVLLRRVLTKDEPSLWPKLSTNVQVFVKQNLLTALKEEKDKSINKKVCDTTAELAAGMIDSNTWPELLPSLFALVQSQEPDQIESALLVFSQLAHYMMPVLTQYMGTLNAILQQSLQSPNVGVAIAGMKAATAFIEELEDGQERDKFQPLVPVMLGAIATVLNAGDEVAAQEALELFIEVAEAHPRFLRRQLGDILTAMLQIAVADTLEESTRQLAAEFLVTLCEAREKAPGMMRKLPQIIGRLFQCLMSFLLDIEDEPNWHRADTDEHEDEGEGDLYEFGQECLDRLALSLGGNSIAPLASQLLPQLIQSQDWKQRHAALIGLAQIAEGCAKVMAKNMSGLVDICLRGLQDQHPKVRWAGCQALGQMCTDLEPDLQSEEHSRILPALLALTDDFSQPRVQAHAAAAIVNFTEGCEKDILPPYLEALTLKLIALLRNGQKTVQEGALTALASVADCSKSHFLNYYGQVMPLLREILTHCNDKSMHLMRAKALECISLVGMSIGRERFREDAHQVLQYMQTLQSQELEPDDPTIGYMLQAGARLCKCLQDEFLPYLNIVMPPLLQSAELKPDVNVASGDSDSDDDNDDDEVETIYMGDKKVSIRTSVLEEKATACSMLCCYADELAEGFYPYVERVAGIMVPLLKFYFHEEVRRSAVQCLPELLKSANLAAEKGLHGATKANVKAMLDFFWPALIDAISKEPDVDLLSEMLEALQGLIDIAAPDLVSQAQLASAFERFKSVLDGSGKRRLERLQRVSNEDFDSEEEEALEDENEEEEDLLDHLGGALTSILREYKDAAMPFIDTLMPQIGQLLDPSRSPGERRVAICMIDDLLEHSEAGAQKYMVQALPVILEASKDADANLRQCAVFGLGVLAEHRPSGFQQIAANAIQTLLTVINAPDSRSEDNASATENAIAALGKVLEFQPNVVDAAQGKALAETWLNALPLVEDTVEAMNVHKQLIKFIEKSDPRILGEDNKHLPKIVQIMAIVLSKGHTLIEAEHATRMKELLLQMQQGVPPQVMQNLLSQLKPKDAQKLQRVLAGE